jgi:hypothetical protein
LSKLGGIGFDLQFLYVTAVTRIDRFAGARWIALNMAKLPELMRKV